MKITGITVYTYNASWVHGAYGMSHGRKQTGEPVLVARVATDEGIEGWAESGPHGRTYLPSSFEGELAALGVLGPAVTGLDPRNVELLNQTMDATMQGNTAAKAIIDMACWDIFGKSVGLPVCDLLGGKLQETFPLFVAVPVDTLDAMVAHLKRDYAAGIRFFQVKVGDKPADDVARVRAVLQAAGPDSTVWADANRGWSLNSALQAARALDGLPVRLEQPCASIADCAELRKHTALPLILDENIVTIEDLMLARYTAGATGINLKPSRVGGLTKARAIRDVAQGLRMTFTIDDTWGGALTSAQNGHLAATCDPEYFTAATRFADWIEPLVGTVAPSGTPGHGAVSTEPGLGVTVDVDLLGEPILNV